MAEEAKVETPETPAEKQEESVDLESLKAELERLKVENGKLKNAQSSASADAAKWKKEARDKMDAQARAEAETKELIDQLRADNERMKKEQEVALRTAAFTGEGFDTATAAKAAEAWGTDHSAFMDAFKEFLAAHDKALQADALRSTPRPGASGASPAVTKEQFEKMTYSERVKLYDEQPDLYHELVK